MGEGAQQLAKGQQIGPYEVVSVLGAGGMGVVYRARDKRLGRDVAVKLLSGDLGARPEWMRRFELEARAVAALSHPNVLAVYDVGLHDGMPYLVSELLEGESLRERLARGPLSPTETAKIGAQIAHGLAAAHDKNIIHRDLKPDNVYLVRGDRVKILDFGLAKIDGLLDADQGSTMPATAPGIIMGTVQYMSPELARGEAADARSDLFSVGIILHELVSGRLPFKGASAVETLNAIITADPPPLEGGDERLERVIRRCLEKKPEARYPSAHELAAALEVVAVRDSAPTRVGFVRPIVARKRRAWPLVAGGLAIALAGFGAGIVVRRRPAAIRPSTSPSFLQVTRRRGYVYAARFAQDGKSIAYAASWEDRPVQDFLAVPGDPDARAISEPGTGLLAVSRGDELAISSGQTMTHAWEYPGTLARTNLLGGNSTRPLLDGVVWADFGPDGKLAAARLDGKQYVVEYPLGHEIYRTTGWISHLRVSPKGDLVAFADHPYPLDDRGSVAVIDAAGKKRTITPEYGTLQGVAWGPAGDEIWFTGDESSNKRALRVASLGGKVRVALAEPDGLVVEDVAADGRVLLARESWRVSLHYAPTGGPERELSWFDWSNMGDLSADGKTVVFDEDGLGFNYSVFARPTDGGAALRLGDGISDGISPDGKWVLGETYSPDTLQIMPTGTGAAPQVSLGPLEGFREARWFPDSRRFVFSAHEHGKGMRVWTASLDGGAPRAITPEGVDLERAGVSPDGTTVVGASDEGAALYRIEDGARIPVAGLAPEERAQRWSADGKYLYVNKKGAIVEVFRLEVATGKRELWRTIAPEDPAGLVEVSYVMPTPDGSAYAYSVGRTVSDLFIVSGVR